MKKRILFSLFILTMSLPKGAFATHNISGDITYRCLGGNLYEITVHTFTNVASPADRCHLTILFGDGDSAVAPRINGPISSNCSPSGDGVQIGNNVKYNVYQCTHVYPGDGLYTIAMDDPNREAAILNIPNSVNTVFSLRAYLKINSLMGPNSTPTWNHYIDIDTVYTYGWHSFNTSGVDVDGDSVVYTHVPCINAPGYVPPSNSTYFGIDPNTGLLSWDVPNQIGYFSYSVHVEEWRQVGNNYYLIGYTTREIFNVVIAGNGINDLNKNLIQTNVYPNPSNTDLTITLNSPARFSNLKLEVLDISGRAIAVKYEVKDQSIIVKRQGLNPGFYIYKLSDKGQYLVDGKFEILESN